MSYVRPVRVDELVEWLNSVNVEDIEGLAQALTERFDIITTSNSPA